MKIKDYQAPEKVGRTQDLKYRSQNEPQIGEQEGSKENEHNGCALGRFVDSIGEFRGFPYESVIFF